ncbi:MAG: hypothetical protein AAGA26_02940 [Pseudomonadota bacterium]
MTAMGPATAPAERATFTVRLSPELIQIARGQHQRDSDVGPVADALDEERREAKANLPVQTAEANDCDPAPIETNVDQAGQDIELAPPFHRILLRRDGARPLLIIGAPLMRRERSVQWRGRQHSVLTLSLYLWSDGGEPTRVILALAIELPEGVPGWSRHDVIEIEGGRPAFSVLRQIDPAACLTNKGSRDVEDFAVRLRAAYRELCDLLFHSGSSAPRKDQ